MRHSSVGADGPGVDTPHRPFVVEQNISAGDEFNVAVLVENHPAPAILAYLDVGIVT
jgi:hypothetical protein